MESALGDLKSAIEIESIIIHYYYYLFYLIPDRHALVTGCNCRMNGCSFSADRLMMVPDSAPH